MWLQEALAEEQRLAARYVNDIEIAKAQRDFELKKAAYDQEVQTKKSQSDLAYSLQVCVDANLSHHMLTYFRLKFNYWLILVTFWPEIGNWN